jgi:phosphoglycolate phosphatase
VPRVSAALLQNNLRWHCVVFDLDGTLLDTREALLMAINGLLKRLQRRAVLANEVADVMHEGMAAMLTRALSLTGAMPDPATCAMLHVEVSRRYLESAAGAIVPFPALTPLLELLRVSRVSMAVCTNQLEAHARALLAHFDLSRFFLEVVGRDTFAVPKPNPLPLIWLLGRCGVHPTQALMVGDSELDAQCGLAAGADVLLMRHGYGGPATLAKHPSCHDFAALHQLMQSKLRVQPIGKTELNLDSGLT